MRPILASKNSFNYQAVVWLNTILTPLQEQSSVLKDTFSFCKLISKIPQLNQTFLVSFVVQSLFTNIQVNFTINLGRQRVEWLKRRARDQHGLGSKLTRAILLCPWEKHFMAHSPAWWSWQAVLNYSHISIKLQRIAISWYLRKQVGVIAYPMY